MNSWINKRAAEGSIGVVSDDAIITCSLKNEALDEAQAKIQAGEAPLNVLGKDAIHIPYFNVTSVEFDEHEEEIEIAYKSGKEGKSKTISFTDKEARKAAFQLIELRLGEGFTSLTESYTKIRAIYMPLMMLTIFEFLTWVMHGAASDIAAGAEAGISGRHQGIKAIFYWVMDLIGPIGVLIVGSLFMALAVMMLVQRFKMPYLLASGTSSCLRSSSASVLSMNRKKRPEPRVATARYPLAIRATYSSPARLDRAPGVHSWAILRSP